MISIQQALQYISDPSIYTQLIEVKPITEVVGKVLATDIFSPIDMPPFRQSAMDGYGVHGTDGNSYVMIDEIKAGDVHQPILKRGEAVRIFTGAAVPDTVNAVIMQEKVEANASKILLNDTVISGKNIRPKGEQILKGEKALPKGTKLTAAGIGFLTTLGITEVEVYKTPSIAVVVTGNELTAVGEPLQYGKIYESNSHMIRAALQELGYTTVKSYQIKDDYEATVSQFEQLIPNHDLVIITGGISVGDYDYVGKALTALGTESVFYKVKQKPGKPLFFGKNDKTLIYALPGNPAAALTCFYVYVQQSLKLFNGEKTATFEDLFESAILKNKYIKKGSRAQFLKGIETEGIVTVMEGQSSAMLHTFALANVLIYVPENIEELREGEKVSIIRLPS